MTDKPEGDRPDAGPAFQSDAFQADAFQVKGERFFGALSLTFAGILYTALVAVAGVVVATIPARGWAKVWVVGAYVALCVALFSWGVTRGRGPVITWSRRLLRLPSNRG